MGFFDLFKPKLPTVQSILPDAAVNEIMHGRLPILRTDKVFLKRGEQCHYIDKAIYEKRSVRKRYIRSNHATTFPGMFAKEIRHSYGGGTTDVVDNVQYSTTRGILYITNRRLIFVGGQGGFDKKLDELIAITPYSNGVDIQTSKENYKMFVPDGKIVHAVLQMVR